MRHNIKIDITISFTAKWHIGSGEGSMLLDRLISRDACNWPYIPGSSLKGVIRESCEKLSLTLGFNKPADPHQSDLTIQDNFKPLDQLRSPVDRLFGNKYNGVDLFFRDARLKSKPPYAFSSEQSRICKYRMINTAKEKHLFSSEYIRPMEFTTTIEGWHENLVSLEETDPPYAYCLLIAGILNVERIGGDKSTGCGQIKILLNEIKYNGNNISLETVFEYLDSELYEETR